MAAKISIVDTQPTFLPGEDAIHQDARLTLLHELGHSLGMDHFNTAGITTVMHSGPPAVRVGRRTAAGSLVDRADTIMPDDVLFAAQYHGSSGGASDIAVTAEFWDGAQVQLLNPGSIFACPGSQVSIWISHLIKGKNNVTIQVPLRVVLSSDSVIASNDFAVYFFNVWGDRGASYFNLLTFTTPALTQGTYHLGAVLDPTNVLAEEEEGNNAVDLNLDIIIPAC